MKRRVLARIDSACDDCTAYGEVIEVGKRTVVLEISHDLTCPALAAMKTPTEGETP